MRARESDGLCAVCGLVKDLRREHLNGVHTRVVEACVTCTRERQQRRWDWHEVWADINYIKAIVNLRLAGGHFDCEHERTRTARSRCRERKRVAQGLPRKLKS